MSIDDKIMIELADWVLETVDLGTVITNSLVHNKLSEIMKTHNEELIEV